jgi:ATP adenylyltransferase
LDRLYAPWRMPYILSEVEKEKLEAEKKKHDGGCIFCDLPGAGPENYRENLILSCGERAFIILNRYPYNNGHLMVVPRQHVSDPSLLTSDDYQLLSELVRRATQALYRATGPHAINLGMNLGRTAGAGIHEHCHYHLVPRWDGDNNFMPVIANIKVISEGLHATYDRFFDEFSELATGLEAELR